MRMHQPNPWFPLLVTVLTCSCADDSGGPSRANAPTQGHAADAAPQVGAQQASHGDPPPIRDEAKEPRLSFVVRLGSKEVRLSEGETTVAPGDFSNPSISVTMDPVRRFDALGIRFDYPREFMFEADLDSEANDSWTLSGNNVKIMVLRLPADASDEYMARQLAAQYGGQTSIRPVVMALGQREYAGWRVHAEVATMSFVQDIFALPGIDGRARFIVVQDESEQATAESTYVRGLLARTFQVVR